ncbi:MAG: hypothetical protein U0271_23280 [Polyangiaceae bacterium]
MIAIERYTVFEDVPARGVVSLQASDPLFPGARVTLHVARLTSDNEAAITSLRADARRIAIARPELDVRVFEDLGRAIIGVAYRDRQPAKATLAGAHGSLHPTVGLGAPNIPPPPRPTAKRSSNARAAVVGAVAAAAFIGLVFKVMEIRDLFDSRAPASGRARSSATLAPVPLDSDARLDPASRSKSPPLSRTACAEGTLALSTGCLMRDPVTARDFDSCKECRTVQDVILHPPPLSREAIEEQELCSARPPNTWARCVTFAEANAYCTKRGARVPLLEELTEAYENGLRLASSFEWSSSAWKTDGLMRRTLSDKGEPSQNLRTLRGQGLGFRCIYPRRSEP